MTMILSSLGNQEHSLFYRYEGQRCALDSLSSTNRKRLEKFRAGSPCASPPRVVAGVLVSTVAGLCGLWEAKASFVCDSGEILANQKIITHLEL